MADERIGVIGLGNMGGRIGRRLVDAGERVAGFDVRAGLAESLGIPAAASVAELVAGTDVILLSLPDSRAVEAVMGGDAGLVAHSRLGQLVCDLSTSSPASTRRLHAELAGRGVAYVDAGISGGPRAAEQGTLTIMAGGAPTALARLAPVLERFATRVHHLGASGAGHTAKLLNNYLNATSLAATAEVMLAARAAGLDLRELLDVVNHSSGVNYATRERFPRVVEGDYVEGGLSVDLMAKDVLLYLELLRDLGQTTLTGSGTLGAFTLASRLGYGEQVSNRVVDALGDLAGGLRLQDPPLE